MRTGAGARRASRSGAGRRRGRRRARATHTLRRGHSRRRRDRGALGEMPGRLSDGPGPGGQLVADAGGRGRRRYAGRSDRGRSAATPTRSEYELALEDIEPDAVIAAPRERWRTGQLGRRVFPAGDACSRGLAASGSTRNHAGVERWHGGVADRHDVGLDRSSEVRRPVRSRRSGTPGSRPSTPSACGPVIAVGALVPLSSVAAFCFGMHLPAMLGGADGLPRQVEPDAALDAPRDRQVDAGRCWCRPWPCSSPWSRVRRARCRR